MEDKMNEKKLRPVAPELVIKRDEGEIVFLVECVQMGARTFAGFSARGSTHKEALAAFVAGWERYCKKNFGRYLVLTFENADDVL